jgi:hypothetical protein
MVLSNVAVIIVVIALFGPPLQRLSWRLFDLEKRIESLEQRLNQSKDRVSP